MNRTTTLISSFIILVCANTLLFQSCKAKKEANLSDHMISIELIDKYNEQYLTENYKEILSAKRSNKTLNKYLCKINVSKDGYKRLLAELDQDANVLNVSKLSNQTGKPTISTNTNRSKTKPIKQ